MRHNAYPSSVRLSSFNQENIRHEIFSRLLRAFGRLLDALSMTREILANGETAREGELYSPSLLPLLAIASRIKHDHYRADVIRPAFTTK